MDKFELYKSFYDRENNRRDTLNNSISIPIGILSGLIAAIVFLTTKFNYKIQILSTWIFFVLTAIAIVMMCFSVVYLVKSFNNFVKGYDYMEIALLKDIEKYYNELKEYNEKDPDKTEAEFKEYLQKEFIKYADHNAVINDNRSYSLYKSKQFLFFSIVVIALTSIPFGFGEFHETKDTERESKSIDIDSKLEYKIDSLLNLKLNQLENERKKSTKENTSS